jgi:hypothetical protein
VRPATLDVGNHGDTTGITLCGRVVEALRPGDGGEDHSQTLLVVLMVDPGNSVPDGTTAARVLLT